MRRGSSGSSPNDLRNPSSGSIFVIHQTFPSLPALSTSDLPSSLFAYFEAFLPLPPTIGSSFALAYQYVLHQSPAGYLFSVGLALILIGIVLWLALGWAIVGIVLIVLGIFLLFAPGPFYGYGWYRGRRGPPA